MQKIVQYEDDPVPGSWNTRHVFAIDCDDIGIFEQIMEPAYEHIVPPDTKLVIDLDTVRLPDETPLTRLREDTPIPIEIENVATLRSPNSGEQQSLPVVLRVLTFLPETGGHLELWLPLILTGLAATGGGLWRRSAARREGRGGREDS